MPSEADSNCDLLIQEQKYQELFYPGMRLHFCSPDDDDDASDFPSVEAASASTTASVLSAPDPTMTQQLFLSVRLSRRNCLAHITHTYTPKHTGDNHKPMNLFLKGAASQFNKKLGCFEQHF